MTAAKTDPPSELELRRHPVLEVLDDDLLARVLAGTRVVRLQRNETRFEQGEPADRFYLVRSGQVKLFRIGRDGNEKIIHLAGPGDGFGPVSTDTYERRHNGPKECPCPSEEDSVPSSSAKRLN